MAFERLCGVIWRVAAAFLLLLAAPAQAGCGADPAPCDLGDGSYHAILPENSRGAVVFLHGYGGSGKDTLSNTGMVEALVGRGYAVIAPDGLLMPGRERRSWDFRGDETGGRNDIAFLREVADDAAERFDLPRENMVLAGFSVGGSMVAYAACSDPSAYSAYALISGNFWRPYPDGCAAPVRLLHVHGWTDGTVPLEGRRLREGIEQGDSFAAMEIWRRVNGCVRNDPDIKDLEGDLMRRVWTDCAPGSALQFVLHPGGHMIPPFWADLMLDWFEGK